MLTDWNAERSCQYRDRVRHTWPIGTGFMTIIRQGILAKLCQAPVPLGWVALLSKNSLHHLYTNRNRSNKLSTSLHYLSRYWPNKGWFLGASRTDSNCNSDICPGDICPGNICPYQEYLSCYWPDFEKTLKVASWEHLEQISTVTGTFVQATFVLAIFVNIRNISTVSDLSLTKL